MPAQRLEDDMSVIRHDAPGKQSVAAAIKMAECFSYHFGDRGFRQVTRPCSSIQVGFNALGEEFLEALLLGGRKISPLLFRRGEDVCPLGFECF